MAQATDYSLANQSGANFRSELNSILAAVVSQNSGSTAPATTYAYQTWIDTGVEPPLLKIRNGANNAWITIGDVTATNLGLAALTGATFTGNVTLNAQSDLRFADSDSTNWVAFQAPSTVTTDVTWTLPSVDGTQNQVLGTNGTGTLGWLSVPLSGSVVNADISATAEIAVSKLADGAARQVLQTAANGTDVEWTDSIDLPGTLDVTGQATFDSGVYIAGSLVLEGTTADDFEVTIAAEPTADCTVTLPNATTTLAGLGLAQTFSAAQRGAISALGNSSGTITLDMATANNFSLTLNANSSNTLANPSNLTAGQSGCIYITQDSSGSRLLSYGTNWDFAGGTAPTLSTSANAVDVLVYTVISNSSIAAQLIKDVK